MPERVGVSGKGRPPSAVTMSNQRQSARVVRSASERKARRSSQCPRRFLPRAEVGARVLRRRRSSRCVWNPPVDSFQEGPKCKSSPTRSRSAEKHGHTLSRVFDDGTVQSRAKEVLAIRQHGCKPAGQHHRQPAYDATPACYLGSSPEPPMPFACASIRSNDPVSHRTAAMPNSC